MPVNVALGDALVVRLGMLLGTSVDDALGRVLGRTVGPDTGQCGTGRLGRYRRFTRSRTAGGGAIVWAI